MNVGRCVRRTLPLIAAIPLVLVSTPASSADNPEAIEELKQGYSLKQVGNCRDALAHLTRSVQLYATSRALLNLSDCEKQLGDLVAAQGHAAHGRELARQKSDAELVGVADEQLAEIDRRLPRLTIRLAQGAPRDCSVVRDGVAVDASTLGASVPVNPGAHIVTIAARGRAERRFDVTLDEGVRRELEVEPGPKTGLEPVASAERPARPAPEATSPRETEEKGPPARVPAYVVLGLGAAGLAVGIVTGVVANSKHDALANECDSGNCPPSAQGDLDAFHSMRTVSTVAYVVGVVGLVAGGVLWLTVPSPHPARASAHVWLGPGSAGIGGRF